MKTCCMIGCGGIGQYHLSHLIGFTDAITLPGFCDLVEERAIRFAETARLSTGGDARAYTNYRTMLDAETPDMVFLCVPPYCHGEIEAELIRRQIPFFVEKPMALDLDTAEQIAQAVAETQLITAVGFQCRYSNLVEPNRAFCREHEVVFIDATRIGSIPGMFWWKDKELSGGQIVEQTIHQFDILRYVFGEPAAVVTYGTRGFVRGVVDYDTDDASVTIVRFQNGALATISTGCYAASGDSFDSAVIFSAADCRAELKILDSLVLHGLAEADEKTRRKNDVTWMPSPGQTLTYTQDGDAGILCDRTFVDAVITGDGSRIRSPYADAMKTLRFVLACNESMASGKEVKLS